MLPTPVTVVFLADHAEGRRIYKRGQVVRMSKHHAAVLIRDGIVRLAPKEET